ncbi:MAG: UDP-N-acetylmuramoyl-tripeptide--D-alanyl-D-alanine ligase [Opitutales bacterium]|nr:UDP-N-acetylmuramoyl-tripeptide--D-alanyl-D-alanine ligase [Opitutales bacterium]
MPLFKIDDLQVWTGGTWSNLPKKYPEIKGFSTDSRDMPAGFAFVALCANRDGHDFVADAAKNGAVAAIVSKDVEADIPLLKVGDTLKALQTIAKFHRLRFDAPVVGITGSCGKTSTKEFLARLAAWKKPLATKGNLNNEIGVALTLTQIDIRENLCAIVEAGVGKPGQMKELADMIEPDIAIITSVAPAHMEGFGEISNIAKEKSLLARGAAKDGWVLTHSNLLSWKAFEELECKKAILAPADAPDVRGDLVFRYFLKEEDGVQKIEMAIEDGSEYYFEMPVLTKGMTENALLAIAAALMLGTTEVQIAGRLSGLAAGAMRGAVCETQNAKFYVDCYNASPASMKDALRRFITLSENSPRMFVLGGMAELGLATLRYHKEIGEMLPCSENAKAVLVGANAQIYKNALLSKGWAEENILIFDSSISAREALANFEGWVFVKGSRVCELEKALPDEVKETLSIAKDKAPDEEPDIEAEAQPEESAEDENGGEGEDGGDEGFDEGEDFGEDEPEEEDESEEEKGESLEDRF